MIWPVLLIVLTNTLMEVPASQWKSLDVEIPQHGTTIECFYEVKHGSRVQILLTDRMQAERFHRGRSVAPLHATGFREEGHFRYRVQDAGQYVLIVDNRIEGRSPAQVALRLELSNPGNAQVRELPPERRRAVVSLSLLFFGAVVLFSARQYLKNA